MSRRRVLRLALGGLVGVGVSCSENGTLDSVFRSGGDPGPDYSSGRLTARVPERPATDRGVRMGMQPLGLDQPFDGFLYVPPGYDSRRPAPLAVTLHGSGGGANKGIGPLLEFADEAGSILVSPKSRGQTWDAVMGGFGPDVEFIDRALRKVFSSYAVDPGRLAIQGFSDGASYALTLGLTNGDLFTHIIALSPGFTSEEEPRGDPKIFIAHGTDDGVLPIDQTSRQIVPRLEGAGYDVTFVEFDGGHVRKPEIIGGAVTWWLGEGRD